MEEKGVSEGLVHLYEYIFNNLYIIAMLQFFIFLNMNAINGNILKKCYASYKDTLPVLILAKI